LLNIPDKTKDGVNVRKDMEELKIRKDLHVQLRVGRPYLPAACYNTGKEEKRMFC
jgi:hypothetical protein